MLCFWSAKGGAGCSVTAAAVALLAAEHGGTLLIDMAGEQPAVLGLAPADGPGLAEWLRRDEPPPPDALARLERHVTGGLRLLSVGPSPAGVGQLADGRLALLGHLLTGEARTVVVDLGCWRPGHEALAAQASARILVTRLCYLALRAASDGPTPTGVVVVAEAGRALGTDDVRSVVHAPILARVPVDPVIARVVDAGLLTSRLPRPLRRLSALLPDGTAT